MSQGFWKRLAGLLRGGGGGGGDGGGAPAPARGDADRVAAVEAVLAELRPLFKADGGDMRLVAIEDDGRVLVETKGACHGCAVSSLTLQGAIAPKLRERCPWFTRLEAW